MTLAQYIVDYMKHEVDYKWTDPNDTHDMLECVRWAIDAYQGGAR